MSGYEALANLRHWPETRNISVLALSASAMERDVRRALHSGFAQYLTKPVKLDELIEVLET